ncbi:MAG: 2-C-methyl-D-erythritol 2,4-cyclodiphosphate synthase [Bacilli bacterium]|nr:2-C-methyl-D-erythritol 2,4-cyclodiphosphate synthase [Bacilli bacterium]
MKQFSYRIGFGEDIHRLVEGRPLILSGVRIPFEKGLLGHSDADVVYHAVSDAILGSFALGDIGKHFPDNEERTAGMDSSEIVKYCYALIQKQGYEIANIDIAISCERPKLAPHIMQMRQNLAGLLNIALEQVSIKAMTNEGLDAVGEGKAIRATCVVLVKTEV